MTYHDTVGDNGAGVKLGQSVGGATSHLEKCSAWKFLNPPFSFMKALLVDQNGVRISNEDLYGATIASKMISQHDGKGWLIFDETIFGEAMDEAIKGDSQEDQVIRININLRQKRIKASSIPQLAEACKITVWGTCCHNGSL